MNFTTPYNHDGVPLIVHGTRDEDECVITKITAADSQVDLVELFFGNTLASMADCIDAQLTRDAQKQRAAARAERHQWDREFAIA